MKTSPIRANAIFLPSYFSISGYRDFSFFAMPFIIIHSSVSVRYITNIFSRHLFNKIALRHPVLKSFMVMIFKNYYQKEKNTITDSRQSCNNFFKSLTLRQLTDVKQPFWKKKPDFELSLSYRHCYFVSQFLFM